ncbi:MAG TPA: hypothetical protein VJX67_17880 [Blastocatellia bacterium]|nr:hypothetical protein [Blastocatellia bacterium]
MASATITLHDTNREVVSRGWIITQRDDLVWFIGSVVTSYAFLIANVNLGVPVMVLVWIWALGFDGPHVFGTVSRTYADKEERRQRSRLLYGTLVLFLVGPSMVLAGRASLFGTKVWGPVFFFFASLWAYYHLVKQHYGFMVLYKKKNNDLAEFDNLTDRAFILLGMTYPFLHFLSHGVAAGGRVPFSTGSGPFWWFETMVLLAFLVSLGIFVGRQVQRWYAKKPINGPKILLLAAAIPMHWIVLRYLESEVYGALAAVATLTIYHNIQYHRIIWFHNANKYGKGEPAKYGLASIINKNFFRYFGFALLFGAAYHIPHYTVVAPYGVAMSFIWGGAFTHYYLDSKIWRVRHDKQLNKTLRMGDEPATAGVVQG